MELCLVRHAIAGERGDPRWPDDRLRPLTERGIERMETAAAGLRLLFRPDIILTSPLVRARQTAEILAAALGVRMVEEADALASGDDGLLFDHLAALGCERAIAVGHEPWMSATLANCLAGDGDAFRTDFRKGAAALASFAGAAAAGQGTLEWLLQPSTLRRLANASR